MANDGSITFGTKLDNSGLERDLKKAEKAVDALKAKIEGEKANRNAIKEQMDEAAGSVERFKGRIEELEREYEGMKASLSGVTDSGTYAAIAEDMRQNLVHQKAARELLAESQAELSGYEQKWLAATDKLRGYCAQLRNAKSNQRELSAELAQMYKAKNGEWYSSRLSYAFSRIREAGRKTADGVKASHSNAAKAVQQGYQTIAARLKSMFKGIVPFVTLAAGFKLLLSKMKEFMAQNKQVSDGITGLKAACSGFASGLAQIVSPAVLGFLRVATTMVMTLARLIDSIFHTDLAGHIAAQLQAAAASGAADGAEDQAKATDKLAKSLKAANRQLMAFDELNVLNADKEDDDSDALDDLADDMGGGGFDPSSLLDGIDETLAKIMLLAGAALLAVGIILVFSGANVPLGLALMAIGALMIYTAVAEQWDKMPEQVQDTMSLILAVIAGALIVVGVILCLTAHVPLGIAFIIAGAAIFAVDAAINPDYVGGLVATMFQHILGIIAGLLVVVGIVLLVTGHPLLGVAFVIAGAALFVMEAVLNYDKVPDEVRGFLVGMLAAIGAALIVIGVILCATGHPVLGIAAILVGVLAFVASAALDEEDAPNRIRTFLQQMLPVIGEALAVVGVLLCVTGRIILGIAAIVFGIAVWVTGEALSEGVASDKIIDFLQRMIPEIGKALVVLGVLVCIFSMGTQAPIGIALIVAGVALWVTGEVINENLTKEKIQDFIDSVLPIIATGMIVLGVILLAMSAGTLAPIALGLIAAGIGALVFTQVDFDWDFLLNKIKEIWGNIKNFWHSNIEHVFTIEFWQGIFKSIVNGLIGMINEGLNAFGGFVNSLAEGVSGILGFFGVGGYSFQIGMPQIPYLATGAVIPPNRRFMAVLGDQTNGRNLEAPESLIRQIVREESGAGSSDVLYQILEAIRQGQNIYMDGDKVGSTVSAYQASMQRVNGW